MNILKFLFPIFVSILITVNSFCVQQEKSHVLLHAGDHLNDEIYNFSIRTRNGENCEQLLWINFFIEWKWTFSEENFDLLSQELKTFQAAFGTYIDAMFQKYKKFPIEMILESIDVKVDDPGKADGFTGIETLFKCKSTLAINSQFLEQDCDDTMRILLENFRVRQLFLYFQDESVSAEVYYDYFESEAAKIDSELKQETQATQISPEIKFTQPTEDNPTTQLPQNLQTRNLQTQLEEIYDDIQNDFSTDHKTHDFYIKNIIPLKNDELNFFIAAEILFPWIDPKNLSNQNPQNYQKLLKTFTEYSEKLYAANPLTQNSKIKCKVDEIFDSFEEIGQHFIAIPNALIVNFRLSPIGFEIGDDDVKLVDGNKFDEIFENFKSAELFKAYERDENDEYFVDRDGFIFDNFINVEDVKLRSLWNNEDYYDFVDDPEDYFDTYQTSSSTHHQVNIPMSTEPVTTNHPMQPKTAIKTEMNQNLSESQLPVHSDDPTVPVTPDINIEFSINSNEPVVILKGVEIEIEKKSEKFTCKNCKILIYSNFLMEIIDLSEELNNDEDADYEVDYSEYDTDINSIEKLENILTSDTESNSESEESSNENSPIHEFYNKIGFAMQVENIDEIDSNESQTILKKFDPNDPMWKNIIVTPKEEENKDKIWDKSEDDAEENEVDVLNDSKEVNSTHKLIAIIVSNVNKSTPTVGEFSIIEDFESFKHDDTDADSHETLPPNENYVMINRSSRVKIQGIVAVFITFLIVI